MQDFSHSHRREKHVFFTKYNWLEYSYDLSLGLSFPVLMDFSKISSLAFSPSILWDPQPIDSRTLYYYTCLSSVTIENSLDIMEKLQLHSLYSGISMHYPQNSNFLFFPNVSLIFIEIFCWLNAPNGVSRRLIDILNVLRHISCSLVTQRNNELAMREGKIHE